jgi:hypothetical protein
LATIAKRRDAEIARAYDGMTAVASFICQLTFSPQAIQRYRRLRAQTIKVGKKDLCIAAS